MILWLLYLLSCSVGLVFLASPTADTFVFPFCPETIGETNTGRVTFSAPGSIGRNQKIVNIPLNVDYCMILTDVHVTVDNPVGPPVVKLDRDLLLVTVQYRPKQASISTYLVTAKTLHDKNCTTSGAGQNGQSAS